MAVSRLTSTMTFKGYYNNLSCHSNRYANIGIISNWLNHVENLYTFKIYTPTYTHTHTPIHTHTHTHTILSVHDNGT